MAGPNKSVPCSSQGPDGPHDANQCYSWQPKQNLFQPISRQKALGGKAGMRTLARAEINLSLDGCEAGRLRQA